jgi:SAM-dependent methyltransferase
MLSALRFAESEVRTWRPYRDLFLISFVILFFELACIRWFGSMVVYLTFFTNIILLATFLGMSVGCMSALKGRDWTGMVIPLFIVAAMAACGVLWLFGHNARLLVDVGSQGSPQQVYFGTEYQARDVSQFFQIPLELVAAFFFYLVTFIFVGLGQALGRALDASPDRLRAYISNIVGSLVGILAFSFASYLWTTPLIWFAVAMLIWIYLLKRNRLVQGCLGLAALILVGLFSYVSITRDDAAPNAHRSLIWSPYYKIAYTPEIGQIDTNNLSHQRMVDVHNHGTAYSLPYLLNRDAGGQPFDNVLVIGAGSGNDVSAALAFGAKHVDAVEIDPAILQLGLAHHPDQPYRDPRVTVHIGDGRSFLKTTNKQYDLIIYALVDSLVLHSGYSNLRLESFLFTQEAFQEVAARLKPSGMFVAYNYFRQGWIVLRIDRMLDNAFKAEPLVASLPYVPSIHAGDQEFGKLTMILSGGNGSRLQAIQREFKEHQSFWVNQTPAANLAIGGFGTEPPSGDDPANSAWRRIAPAVVDTVGVSEVSTDDWPFLASVSEASPSSEDCHC